MAFACDASTSVTDGDEWSPIEGRTPANDPWAPVQGFINAFNKNQCEKYAASPCKIVDKSMSPFKPRQSATANLPHLCFIQRKPKFLGTKLKALADTDKLYILLKK